MNLFILYVVTEADTGSFTSAPSDFPWTILLHIIIYFIKREGYKKKSRTIFILIINLDLIYNIKN